MTGVSGLAQKAPRLARSLATPGAGSSLCQFTEWERIAAYGRLRIAQQGVKSAMSAQVRMTLSLVSLWLAFATQAQANASHQICDHAAQRAAEQTGVPPVLLQAIARVESGRGQEGGFAPWPWTVNRAGDGHHFPDQASALSAVEAALATGESNIDIGCFQINLHWHGDAFSSLSAMFDPDSNALYAARYLKQLQKQTGSWRLAAGAYHSKRDEAARAYVEKVAAMMANAVPIPTDPGPDTPRSYALLVPGAGGMLGSVLPGDIGQVAPLLRPSAGALR
ncbi:MAG: lytic transglycosylase domain-containing protein [Cypionkella sp.]|nr:lytic transglycosylase domain-containing protein [Cypionkella sp.]